nr:hypothetical protein [uncultured Holophaga sp.]
MPEPRRWTLERSISLGDLLVFLSLAAAGVGYILHQDQRMTRTEVRTDNLEVQDIRFEKNLQAQKDEIGKKLDRMEEKLDRLVESGHVR